MHCPPRQPHLPCENRAIGYWHTKRGYLERKSQMRDQWGRSERFRKWGAWGVRRSEWIPTKDDDHYTMPIPESGWQIRVG